MNNTAKMAFVPTPVKLSKKQKETEPRLDKGYAKWMDRMRKFTESRKETCKAYQKERVVQTIEKKFPTGSTYEGTWDMFMMTGYGVFNFPIRYSYDKEISVTYDGAFDEGEFHGEGEYSYGDGICVRGKFERGVMTERKVFFENGLEYSDSDWKYCRMPDRRFASEVKGGLKPGGDSEMTADLPTIPITIPDLYDTTDGFYNKNEGCVYKYEDSNKIERVPNLVEGAWIEDNCRNGYDEPIGPSPKLYESWQEVSQTLPELPESAPFDEEEEQLDDQVFGGARNSRRSTIGAKFKRKFGYNPTAVTSNQAIKPLKI